MNAKRYPSRAVLIVDDDENVLVSLSTALKAEGITNVITLSDPTAVLGAMAAEGVGVVLLDLTMPALRGDALLPRIREEHPDAYVVIVTGNAEIESAVACMRSGAYDYLVKPVERTRLVSSVRRMIETQQLADENRELRNRWLGSELAHPKAFAPILTADERLKAVMLYADAISRTAHPVLVTGETGAGKDLFARAIHDASECGGAFVPVNIAGLDDELFADLLFGHRAGSFTGAIGSRDGLIEKARGGTIFLDEIGDLRPSSQVKLLRLLETGEYYPIGSDLLKRSAARVIVATNKDMSKAVENGEFRKDLFYRLHIHHVRVPPLRERIGDVPLLAERFVEEASTVAGRARPELAAEALAYLQSYDFPGNVRELRALIFDAAGACPSRTIDRKWFEPALGTTRKRIDPEAAGISFPPVLPSVKQVGDLLVREALKRARGNQTLAARMVGITPQAISKRLQKEV